MRFFRFSLGSLFPVPVTSVSSDGLLQLAFVAPASASFSLRVYWNGTEISESPYVYTAYASVEVSLAVAV